MDPFHIILDENHVRSSLEAFKCLIQSVHYDRKEHDEHMVLAIDIDIYDIKDVKYQDSSSKLWPSAVFIGSLQNS